MTRKSTHKTEHTLFINMSNHPSNAWDDSQREQAIKMTEEANRQSGGYALPVEIIDMSFPAVRPTGDEAYLDSLISSTFSKLIREIHVRGLPRNSTVFVHIMGEQGLTFGVVRELLTNTVLEDESNVRIIPVHSATRRIVQDSSDGKKVAKFDFVRFRKYL